MIDLHCHLLPGIDDGSDSLAESVAMARLAVSDGISRIIATPHISTPSPDPNLFRESIRNINTRLLELEIPLEVFSGAEVSCQVPPTGVREFTLNNGPYILIEFPHSHLPTNSREIIFKFRAHGYYPIIAHPERNPAIIKDPSRIAEFIDENVYLQITAASVAGHFGRKVKKCALHLLKKGAVHFLASDGHSSTHRRPILSEGVNLTSKIIGADKALMMVTDNPKAVLEGRPLPQY